MQKTILLWISLIRIKRHALKRKCRNKSAGADLDVTTLLRSLFRCSFLARIIEDIPEKAHSNRTSANSTCSRTCSSRFPRGAHLRSSKTILNPPMDRKVLLHHPWRATVRQFLEYLRRGCPLRFLRSYWIFCDASMTWIPSLPLFRFLTCKNYLAYRAWFRGLADEKDASE